MIEQKPRGKLDFGPHGYFTFTVDANLIRIDAVGPGNLEVVHQYNTAMQKQAVQFSGQPWATLLVLDGLPLMPPDATEELIEGMTIAPKHHHLGTAIILEGGCNTPICKSYWQEMFIKSKTSYRFCADEEDASAFLAHLFSA